MVGLELGVIGSLETYRGPHKIRTEHASAASRPGPHTLPSLSERQWPFRPRSQISSSAYSPANRSYRGPRPRGRCVRVEEDQPIERHSSSGVSTWKKERKEDHDEEEAAKVPGQYLGPVQVFPSSVEKGERGYE